ncbi:MAG: glycoside hydrolase family 43 protein [Oceanospirillaceae bacterium]|nr:glycoside hydrolase family 43 protein [Oceanospirillaceae bacterium]
MNSDESKIDQDEIKRTEISTALVKHVYTADPSVHVFDGRIFIYPSHDIEGGIAFNDNGDHFAMHDYHVFSMDNPDAPVVDHGVVLDVKDVPWAQRQMWAPDIACKKGKYYFYFPARAYDGLFKIGVAVGDSPQGPFVAEPEPIAGSYSIDPAAFSDDDGTEYLYWGGLWGGQLQHYPKNDYDQSSELRADHQVALGPRVAQLSDDMLGLKETVREIHIVDDQGRQLLAGDSSRRFFEGPWMHKHQGTYYLSYSTGDTHLICYAIADNPYGPFVYQGVILTPVLGWTTHHSICQIEDQWYLFYHDASLSKGVTHLRSMKMTPLTHLDNGSIKTIDPYVP